MAPGLHAGAAEASSAARVAQDELGEAPATAAPRAEASASGSLPDYGPAPEFTGISDWLQHRPLTLQRLRGKVVLIDFWTYSCINCLRTLPHLEAWDGATARPGS